MKLNIPVVGKGYREDTECHTCEKDEVMKPITKRNRTVITRYSLDPCGCNSSGCSISSKNQNKVTGWDKLTCEDYCTDVHTVHSHSIATRYPHLEASKHYYHTPIKPVELTPSGVSAGALNLKFDPLAVYQKDDMVVYNGKFYLSLIDGNRKLFVNKQAWLEIKFNQPAEIITVDTNPIGCIVTVPLATQIDGYIDYVEGNSFSEYVYPELYKALGTNKFEQFSDSVGSDIPVGTLINVLNDTDVPDGWIKADPLRVNLQSYPELYNVLIGMVNRMPVGSSKTLWSNALTNYRLPDLSNLYLTQGITGNVSEATQGNLNIELLPMVVNSANTLSPIGLTRTDETVVDSIITNTTEETTNKTDLVITGQYATNFTSTDVYTQSLQLGSEDGVLAPKSLHTTLLIKAESDSSSKVSKTHKRLIRAV